MLSGQSHSFTCLPCPKVSLISPVLQLHLSPLSQSFTCPPCPRVSLVSPLPELHLSPLSHSFTCVPCPRASLVFPAPQLYLSPLSHSFTCVPCPRASLVSPVPQLYLSPLSHSFTCFPCPRGSLVSPVPQLHLSSLSHSFTCLSCPRASLVFPVPELHLSSLSQSFTCLPCPKASLVFPVPKLHLSPLFHSFTCLPCPKASLVSPVPELHLSPLSQSFTCPPRPKASLVFPVRELHLSLLSTMFGMMMNKSRRLLRRASTRDNILKKEKERQGLDVTEGEEEGGTICQKTQPYFSVISQGYAVDFAQAAGLDSLSEEGRQSFVSGDGPSRTLTRSTSCTNVLFSSHVIGSATSSGQLGGVHLNYGNFPTTQTGMIKDERQSCGDSRISNKPGSVHSISAGTGSCADIPGQARQGGGSLGQGESIADNTVPTTSASGHCIGLRFKMTLPQGHGIKTDTRERTSSERSVHQDGPDRKREVTSQEIFESDKLKDETFEKLKDDNHDNHKKQPNKTLLRSRSCSFILSLSYQLKDAVRVYGLEVKSKDDIGEIATPSHTSESSSCLGGGNHSSGTHVSTEDVIGNARETIQGNESSSDTISRGKSHGPVHHYRRLRKSRSLLHFAGFTRDAQSGKDKNAPTPNGRRSTILENDGDDDHFDDIFGQEKSDATDDGKRNNDGLCLSVTAKSVSDQEHIQISLEDPQNTDQELLTEERHVIATADGPSENHHVGSDGNLDSFLIDANNELKCQDECGDEAVNQAESSNPDDPGIPSADHRCSSSDCRQCQFLSQFLVPEPPPKILPSSRQRGKSRDPRKYRKSRFFPGVSTSSSTALSVPALLLPQGRGGRGALQRERTHSPSTANIPSGMVPHPPHQQPQLSKSHLSPHYKKPSSFQSRISKLTKAMGIFARRTHSVEVKPSGESGLDLRNKAIADSPLKQDLLCSKSNEKRYPKNQTSFKDVCKRFGVPVSRRVVAPQAPPVPGCEDQSSNTLEKSENIVNGNGYRNTSEDKEDKTATLLTELRTTPKSKNFSSSPSSRKSHRSPYGDESARNINQTSRVSKDVTNVNNSLKRDPKRNFPSQRTASRDKNYSSTSRAENRTDRRNRESSQSKTKTKKLDTVTTQVSSPQDTSSPGEVTQQQESSTATTNNFTGCYRVLPPIEPIPTSEAHPGIAGPTNQIAAQD